MALSRSAVIELATDHLFPLWKKEQEHLDRIDLWYRWDHEPVRIPRAATPEMKALVELAKTPWLRLVVRAASQAMHVDSYRSPDRPASVEVPWAAWQRNDMDYRQIAVHRTALAYASSYVVVLPGSLSNGSTASVMRGKSPRKMQALYSDPAADDWPMYTIHVEPVGNGTDYAVQVLDENDAYYLTCDKSGTGFEYIENREHGVGVCPVVRYANDLDLEGRLAGEVEPFIPVAARINKTAFDRLMAQHYNSWKVRTIAGMVQPTKPDGSVDTEAAAAKKIQLRQDDMLVAEDPDTKFSTLDGTPLDGYIKSWESDVEALAAVSQTPTHTLTGKLINLSADALASARSEFDQKISEYKLACGKSHAQTLRLAAHIEGDAAAAEDFAAHVTWQDTSVRSFAQAADALGKLATMLQVPVEGLWQRIPTVTKEDVDEWKRLAAEGNAIAQLNALLDSQATADVQSGQNGAPNGANAAG